MCQPYYLHAYTVTVCYVAVNHCDDHMTCKQTSLFCGYVISSYDTNMMSIIRRTFHTMLWIGQLLARAFQSKRCRSNLDERHTETYVTGHPFATARMRVCMATEIETLAESANNGDDHRDVILPEPYDHFIDSDSDCSAYDVTASLPAAVDTSCSRLKAHTQRNASRLTQASNTSTQSIVSTRDVVIDNSSSSSSCQAAPRVRMRSAVSSSAVKQAWSAHRNKEKSKMNSGQARALKISLCTCCIFINKTDKVDCIAPVNLQ